MRNSIFVTFILVAVGYGTYWYKTTADICPAPLHYRLGNIDDSFGLSATEAKKFTVEAEAVWEDIARRELFVYDETADFTVNFVFDERQELADKEESLQGQLDNKKAESERIRDVVNELQSEYRDLSKSYDIQVDSYETRLSEYNNKVSQYNDRGGAPSDVFEELEKEKISLSKESESLSKTADELNVFADKINVLGDRGNKLVENYNEDVYKYNDSFGFDREFTQGDYIGDGINVYKFSNNNELLGVLSHEFGHALGIGHVEEEGSLMYYLMEDTDTRLTLSQSDILTFYDVCGQTETLGQKVRGLIRNLL
jgi:uncharacterized protein YoxC